MHHTLMMHIWLISFCRWLVQRGQCNSVVPVSLRSTSSEIVLVDKNFIYYVSKNNNMKYLILLLTYTYCLLLALFIRRFFAWKCGPATLTMGRPDKSCRDDIRFKPPLC